MPSDAPEKNTPAGSSDLLEDLVQGRTGTVLDDATEYLSRRIGEADDYLGNPISEGVANPFGFRDEFGSLQRITEGTRGGITPYHRKHVLTASHPPVYGYRVGDTVPTRWNERSLFRYHVPAMHYRDLARARRTLEGPGRASLPALMAEQDVLDSGIESLGEGAAKLLPEKKGSYEGSPLLKTAYDAGAALAHALAKPDFFDQAVRGKGYLDILGADLAESVRHRNMAAAARESFPHRAFRKAIVPATMGAAGVGTGALLGATVGAPLPFAALQGGAGVLLGLQPDVQILASPPRDIRRTDSLKYFMKSPSGRMLSRAGLLAALGYGAYALQK